MASQLIKILSVALFSSTVFASPIPDGRLLQSRAPAGYKKTLREGKITFPMRGISWRKLGLAATDPIFDRYEVTATGMKSELSISVDRAQGIVIADNLCRDKEICPDERITDLIKAFILDNDLTLNYLAINNIKEPATIPLIQALPKDDFIEPNTKTYSDFTMKSPLGRIGNSRKLGIVQRIYIGDIAAANPAIMVTGGPNMVFLYSGVTIPKMLSGEGVSQAKTASEIMGLPTPADVTKLEMAKKEKGKGKNTNLKTQQQSKATGSNTGTKVQKLKEKRPSLKKCNSMKRDNSWTTNSSRATKPASQSSLTCSEV